MGKEERKEEEQRPRAKREPDLWEEPKVVSGAGIWFLFGGRVVGEEVSRR